MEVELFDYSKINRETLPPAMLPDGKLKAFPFACVLDEVVRRGITPPTPADLQRIIEADRDFVAKLNRLYKFDADGENYLGLDTAEREEVFYLLAQKIAGSAWPCFGDSAAEHELFLKRFNFGLKMLGWSGALEPRDR